MSFVKVMGLTFNLTAAQVEYFAKHAVVPPMLTTASLDYVPMSSGLRTALLRAECKALSEVRIKLLTPMIYGLPPLNDQTASELRSLSELLSNEGDWIITSDEREFAEGIARSHLATKARLELSRLGVHRFADLSRHKLSDATREQCDRLLAAI